MNFQKFPSPQAWKRHTGRAHQVGLSAGALACLGTEPHAHEDPNSFTGWTGTVKILGRDDAITAGQLAAEAIGTGRGVVAKKKDVSFYILHVPISHQAAQELAHAKRVPNIPSPGHGVRTAAYDAIMRPTARARVKANAILQEK
jgi:hypothetical protein